MPFDGEKNVALLKERRDCLPEEIGIFNRDEVERAIVTRLGVRPVWKRHGFLVGFNDAYHVDVNEMLRVTLKDLFGKEEEIRRLCEEFSAKASLVIVPCIAFDSEEPHQYLSLEGDIIAFLYRSESAVDLDYYVI